MRIRTHFSVNHGQNLVYKANFWLPTKAAVSGNS